MVVKQKQYTKLSGRSILSLQKSYLADDHLLIVDGHYKETYKRLYYDDIEAILVCPTSTGTIFAVLLILLGFLIALPIGFGNSDYLPLALIAVLPALIAGYILYGGGSALFGVQTAVQTVLINGVNNRRKARKAHTRLAAEIERVQGVLTESDLQTAVRGESPKEDVNGLKEDSEVAAASPPLPKSTPDDSLYKGLQ